MKDDEFYARCWKKATEDINRASKILTYGKNLSEKIIIDTMATYLKGIEIEVRKEE